MAPTITVDGDEIIDASIDGDAVEEITIDGDLAWAAAVGLDGLTVTRQDGSYTASSGEHVVSNGGTITLPSPVQDGVVMITEVQSSPRLSGSVDGITDPYISGDDSVVFVSDGSAWYSVDRNQIYAIPDSAVSRWKFEQDATDSWGANDGTDNTSAGYTTTAKVGDYAKRFNGGDDYVRISDDASLDSVRSVFAWVYPENLSSGDFADTIYNDGSESSTADDSVRLLRMGADGGRASVVYSGSSYTKASLGQTFNNNQWYHLGFTYATDSTLTSYVDGSAANTDTSGDGGFVEVDNGATIGSLLTGSSSYERYFPGIIDDVRLYDKALTSTEVSNLYNTGSI